MVAALGLVLWSATVNAQDDAGNTGLVRATSAACVPSSIFYWQASAMADVRARDTWVNTNDCLASSDYASGMFDPETYYDVWELDGREGDTLEIDVWSRNFDPRIVLGKPGHQSASTPVVATDLRWAFGRRLSSPSPPPRVALRAGGSVEGSR